MQPVLVHTNEFRVIHGAGKSDGFKSVRNNFTVGVFIHIMLYDYINFYDLISLKSYYKIPLIEPIMSTR